MSDGTINELVMGIRKDLTYAQAKITDLVQALDTLGAMHIPQPRRAGSPHELAEGVCPDCHVGDGHAADCRTLEEVLVAERLRRRKPSA